MQQHASFYVNVRVISGLLQQETCGFGNVFRKILGIILDSVGVSFHGPSVDLSFDVIFFFWEEIFVVLVVGYNIVRYSSICSVILSCPVLLFCNWIQCKYICLVFVLSQGKVAVVKQDW